MDLDASVDLALKAKSGDSTALNELLVRYQGPLRRIVRIRLGARLRNKIESMDIVQEALMIAARKIDGEDLKSSGAILNWLARIAEHKIYDAHDYFTAQCRDQAREKNVNLVVNGESVGWDVADDAATPEEAIGEAQVNAIVDEALMELSEDHREAIVLRQYCGAKWAEIAKAMGRSVPAAKELHRRGWVNLQEIVRPRLGAGGIEAQ